MPLRRREGGGQVSKGIGKEETEKAEQMKREERVRRRFEIPNDTCSIFERWTGGHFLRSDHGVDRIFDPIFMSVQV